MAEADAKDLLDAHQALLAKRAPFEPLWDKLAARVMPAGGRFAAALAPAKRDDEVFDATALNAVPRFAAAIEGILTPRSGRWHDLVATGKASADDRDVGVFLHDLTSRLFRVRYSGNATCAQALHEAYLSLAVFGTGVVSIEDVPGQTIRYRAVPLRECCLAEGADGQVDTLHRLHTLTARQARQAYGDALPPKVADRAEREPEAPVEVLHVVMPAEEIEAKRKDWRGMAFASVHVLVEERVVLRRAGYRTFPFAACRYLTAPGDVYGTGPAMLAAPFIQLLAKAQRSLISAANRHAEPTYVSHDDDLPPPLLAPNAINPGWLDAAGNPRIRALDPGTRWDLAEYLFAHWRDGVDDAFLGRLFLILEQTPQMTATEVLERVREKGTLLAPTAGRLQGELLERMIARELDILGAAGLLDAMPDALLDDGGRIVVRFDGPMARAQREEEVALILAASERLLPLAQFDPKAAGVIDWRAAAREVALKGGVPPGLVRSQGDLAAMDAKEAQAQAQAQALQAAPGLAGAAKDLAQARAAGGLA